jgi:hypothetical protein
MKNVTMLRRKVARFRKKGCEVVDESLRSGGWKFAELRRNIRVLRRRIAIVRRKHCIKAKYYPAQKSVIFHSGPDSIAMHSRVQ